MRPAGAAASTGGRRGAPVWPIAPPVRTLLRVEQRSSHVTDLLDRVKRALADRYSVERELGQGGMAVVFLARDRKLDRSIALKVLRPELAASLGSERFLREIEIAARLSHPNILPLHDCGEIDDLLFYTMPHVAGGSLRHRLRREGRLSLGAVLDIARPVAAALGHAHRHGVIHRDVKPENILFSEGQAMVADFGIAKAVSSAGRKELTRSGLALGTVGYMSAEQASGRSDLDARTDVCGLTCVIYEMLIGETPGVWPVPEEVRLGRFQEIAAAHRERLDCFPGRLEQVLVRGLAMRPAERFASPRELVDAVAQASRPGPKLSDAHMEAIIGRAAEDLAGAPTEGGEPGVLSMGGVEQVAAQVGIPPARVRDAARELERGRDLAPKTGPRARQPATTFRKGRLLVERTIPREVSDAAYEIMVGEVNSQLGFVGNVSVVGRSLHWSGTKPGFVGRDVRVTLTRHSGETHVHVEEHVELRGGSIFAPGWGAGAGALLALGVGTVLGLPEIAIGIAAVPTAVAGAVASAMGIVKGLANHHRAQLERLADRLTDIAKRDAGSG